MDSDAQAAAVAELLKATSSNRHTAEFTDEQKAFIKAYLEGVAGAGMRPSWKLLHEALSGHFGYGQTCTTMARKVKSDEALKGLL